jgi:hypothetical protein
MGQEVRKDWTIPLPVMHALVEAFEVDWRASETLEELEKEATVATYALTAFCGSFRGNDVFLVDLFG